MQSTEKKIKKQKEEKLKLSIRFVATHSIISDSSEAERVLSSEYLRTDEPSRIFMIFNND